MRHLLAAIMLVGCAPTGTLDLAYEGSDDGFAQAQEAASAWNSACGRELVRVQRGAGEVALREQSGSCYGGALGATYSQHVVLDVVGPSAPYRICFEHGWQAPRTLRHEFGHALGLDHTHAGVMCPGDECGWAAARAPVVITAEDCSRVQR